MQRVYEAMSFFAKPVKQDFTFRQCEVRDLNPILFGQFSNDGSILAQLIIVATIHRSCDMIKVWISLILNIF